MRAKAFIVGLVTACWVGALSPGCGSTLSSSVGDGGTNGDGTARHDSSNSGDTGTPADAALGDSGDAASGFDGVDGETHADGGDAAPSADAEACGGCQAGLICCNVLMEGTYSCVNPKTDPENCGGCNRYCEPGSTYCGEGSCVTPPCSTTTCTSGLCCGSSCCAHGRLCCATTMGLQCVGDITCPL